MIKHTTLLAFMLLSSFAFISCDKGGDGNNNNFDRKAMLQGMADNQIMPAYSNLKTSSDELLTAFTAFKANSDQASLTELQDKFKEVYKLWQTCNMFEFGPAMDVALRSNLNTFPTDTTAIQNNITSGTYDLATAANIDAKGLPAIDYLLFAEDDATILAAFQDQARMDYLEDLISDISSKISSVNNAWQNGYSTTFVSRDGIDVGSSLSELVNQMSYQVELIKNAKIGIPLGKRSLGQAFPDKVEAYYSGISTELAILNMNSLAKLYTGEGLNGNYNSLKQYLQAIDAPYNGTSLATALEAQFNIANTNIAAMPAVLSDAITNDPTTVDAAYVEIQKTVVLLKTDMPSALGVLITYQDNDGD